MPRYFFHLFDGQEHIPDDVGLDLEGEVELQSEIVSALSEILEQDTGIKKVARGWNLAVSDEANDVVFTVSLG